MIFPKKIIVFFAVGILITSGCAQESGPQVKPNTSATQPTSQTIPPPEPIPQPTQEKPKNLTLQDLKNATYEVKAQNKTVKLTNGIYFWPPEDLSQPKESYSTKLSEKDVAFGDLNNDGVDDAAVILTTTFGGTGVFYELAAVINQNGTPVSPASIDLGDRIMVNTLKIAAGKINIDMTTHAPEDPMCCPTKKVMETYKLSGNQLIK